MARDCLNCLGIVVDDIYYFYSVYHSANSIKIVFQNSESDEIFKEKFENVDKITVRFKESYIEELIRKHNNVQVN